nr:uncharacterized protein CI109_007347 [Kwoniella shandongensis]KAA5524334.1 hypothetical protein CI109_007347 [Kwoniella shandongensis]
MSSALHSQAQTTTTKPLTTLHVPTIQSLLDEAAVSQGKNAGSYVASRFYHGNHEIPGFTVWFKHPQGAQTNQDQASSSKDNPSIADANKRDLQLLSNESFQKVFKKAIPASLAWLASGGNKSDDKNSPAQKEWESVKQECRDWDLGAYKWKDPDGGEEAYIVGAYTDNAAPKRDQLTQSWVELPSNQSQDPLTSLADSEVQSNESAGLQPAGITLQSLLNMGRDEADGFYTPVSVFQNRNGSKAEEVTSVSINFLVYPNYPSRSTAHKHQDPLTSFFDKTQQKLLSEDSFRKTIGHVGSVLDDVVNSHAIDPELREGDLKMLVKSTSKCDKSVAVSFEISRA